MKLFNRKQANTENKNNAILINALNQFAVKRSDENYLKVLEIINSQKCLIYFPTANNDFVESTEWRKPDKNEKVIPGSLFEIEGRNVIGAFSSTEAMLKWTQKDSEFVAMLGDDFLDFCEKSDIHRVVIDTDQPTMFVMEQTEDQVEKIEVSENSKMMIGKPKEPLSVDFHEKLVKNYSSIDDVEELYHFAILRDQEYIEVIGIKLLDYSGSNYDACTNAMKISLSGQDLKSPVEILYLEDENWRKAIKNVPNSIFYKR